MFISENEKLALFEGSLLMQEQINELNKKIEKITLFESILLMQEEINELHKKIDLYTKASGVDINLCQDNYQEKNQ